MRRLAFLLPLALFAAAAIAFAVPLVTDSDPRDLPSALIGRPAPAFAAAPLPDRAEGLASADLDGGPALVNFFASWCVPCLAEHPVLSRLAETGPLPVYGINHKDKTEDALAWLARNGDPFHRIGRDESGRIAIDWGVYGVPETFLVDAEGQVRWRHAGPLTPEIVERDLEPLLAALGS